MLHFLGQLLHPLNGEGYQFWSGIGSDVFLITGLAAFYKHINCEQKGCWLPGHRHPDHGRPVCRQHYHHDVTPQHLSLVPSVENDPAEADSTPPDPVV